MSEPHAPAKPATDEPQPASAEREETVRPVCQLCGGGLIEIRAKLQCERCHTIWETCCEGVRG